MNAAAWTDVDGAESHEALARQINAEAVAHVASACADYGARLVHFSTDYVFGGRSADMTPWGEDDPLNPQCVYAVTKVEGERAVRGILSDHGAVVRTAWLYSAQGRNFALTMLAKARSGEAVNVVDDQWGQPTWARDVAEHSINLAERMLDDHAPGGIYHAVNSGQATWWQFAREIYARAGADPALVTAIDSEQLTRPAPRPAWSVLGQERWWQAGLSPMRPWHVALDDAMAGFLRPA